MGKNLIQQRSGKGSTSFTSPSFKSRGNACYHPQTLIALKGKIIDLVDSPGHSGPLMIIKYEDKQTSLIQAPEGVHVSQEVAMGDDAPLETGNILPLRAIPDGTSICNIEKVPGDGGCFVKSPGAAGRIASKTEQGISVILPSKKEHIFHPDCRATIGIVAGAGKNEKPFLRAGNKYFAIRARNKVWPRSSGTSMNSVAHPFGGRSSHAKGHASTVSRDAPPGAKVGMIAARRTGRKKLR